MDWQTGIPKPGYIIVFEKPIIWKGKQAWNGKPITRVVRKVVSVRKRLKSGEEVVRYLTEFNALLNIKNMDKRKYRVY